MVNRLIIYLFDKTTKHNKILRPIVNILPRSLRNKLKELRENSYIEHLKTTNILNESKGRLIYRNGKYQNHSIDEQLAKGVNIIGPVTLKTGIGEHLRLVAQAFRDQEINLSINNYDVGALHNNDDLTLNEFVRDNNIYNTNVFCLMSDKLLEFAQKENVKLFKGRYNIHYGAWELPNYPDQWLHLMNLVDEVWAISKFMQESISEKSSVPVIHRPLPVEFVVPIKFKRKYYNLPQDRFLFIFSFDMASSIYRKNPFAVIEAFKKSFKKGNKDVGLVIKVNKTESVKQQREEFKKLSLLVKDYSNVFFIDRILAREEMLGLINVCNAYVSLHRSEGFGLGMAEAMKMGKPVIATNYSGNTDFMNKNNSFLVDYILVPVKKGEYIYGEGQVWAEPDIEHAAYYMRKLFEDREHASSLGVAAKKHIDENYNFKVIGEKYKKRLKLVGVID